MTPARGTEPSSRQSRVSQTRSVEHRSSSASKSQARTQFHSQEEVSATCGPGSTQHSFTHNPKQAGFPPHTGFTHRVVIRVRGTKMVPDRSHTWVKAKRHRPRTMILHLSQGSLSPPLGGGVTRRAHRRERWPTYYFQCSFENPPSTQIDRGQRLGRVLGLNDFVCATDVIIRSPLSRVSSAALKVNYNCFLLRDALRSPLSSLRDENGARLTDSHIPTAAPRGGGKVWRGAPAAIGKGEDRLDRAG